MTIALFNPELSDRAERLYKLIKPHLTYNSTILDIGCGPAPLAGYIHQDFPSAVYLGLDGSASTIEDCRTRYPWPTFTFEHSVYGGKGIPRIILRHYGVFLHLGVDSWQYSKLYRMHGQVLTDAHLRPKLVLLEAGFNDSYRGCYESYEKVQTVYLAHRYGYVGRGKYEWEIEGHPHHLTERHWCLMKRGEK